MSYEPLKTLYRGIADVYNNFKSIFTSEETNYVCVVFKRPSGIVMDTFNAEFERLKKNSKSLKEDPEPNLENKLPPNSQ